MDCLPSTRSRAPFRPLLAWIAAAVIAGCAASPDAPSPVQQLRAAISAGDLAAADALIAGRPADLDTRRALDLAIRGGHVAAVRHFLAATGPDAELDLDATTPLIRTIVDAPPGARPELVALLIAAGADPDRIDRYGRGARDYAAQRGRSDLLALLDGPARTQPGTRLPPFADWLGAGGPTAPVAARGAIVPTAAASTATAAPARGARGRTTDPARRERDAAERRAAESGGSGGVSALLRRSPWRPAAGTGEHAALRFHADGTLDVLRHRDGGGDAVPLPRTWGAWRLDADGTLRVAIVGEPFAAACSGTLEAPEAGAATKAASAAPPTSAPAARRASAASSTRTARPAAETPARGPTERLVLACEELPPLPRVPGAAWSADLAFAMLDRAGPTSPPSIVAIATGRAALPGEPRADDASPGDVASPRLPVVLQGGAPLAACRPGRARPRVPQASDRVSGDWHAFDVHRFESHSPTSGWLCTQPAARDAALKACRARAGQDAAACRSVGGCPAGQASALAGLPGVDAGWLGCGADTGLARQRALDACRADLGCDCQLVAVSGRNLVPTSAGAQCAPPKR